MRTAVRDTQLAEQLVEVPTIISYSSLLQRTMEQNVDIPVPWNAFLSGLRSRTLISLLVEAPKIFSQDRVHLHLLHLQLVFMVQQMCLSSPSTPAAHMDALSGMEFLAKFQQLSDHVGEMERRYSHEAHGITSDIARLYRLITEARHRLQLLQAWVEEGSGDDDGPG